MMLAVLHLAEDAEEGGRYGFKCFVEHPVGAGGDCDVHRARVGWADGGGLGLLFLPGGEGDFVGEPGFQSGERTQFGYDLLLQAGKCGGHGDSFARA